MKNKDIHIELMILDNLMKNQHCHSFPCTYIRIIYQGLKFYNKCFGEEIGWFFGLAVGDTSMQSLKASAAVSLGPLSFVMQSLDQPQFQ